MKIAPAVTVTLAVIGALWLTKTCSYRAGRADERLLAKDDSLNAVIVAQRRVAADSQKAFDRARDSTGRVIRALQRRTASQTSPDTTVSGGSNSSAVALVPDVRDSLIASLLAGRAQDSLQILFWRAAVGQRDSLVAGLQQTRNQWRREASKPSYTVTDIGGGVLLGAGLAKDNVTVAGLGGALIILPRVVAAIGNLF